MKNSVFQLSMAFAISAAMCASGANAAIFNLTAEADAQLDEMDSQAGNPSLAGGNDIDSSPESLSLRTRSNSTPRHVMALVRIPIDELAGLTVNDVTFELTPLASQSTGFKIVYYGLRESDSLVGGLDWDESSITYNTAPGVMSDGVVPTAEVVATHQILDMVPLSSGSGGTGIVATYMGQDDASISPSVNVQADWSYNDSRLTDFITEAVEGGDSSITLALHMTRGNSTTYSFYSQNATVTTAGNGFDAGDPLPESFKPRLVVDAVPEPSSILLLAIGSSLALLSRKRR